MAEDYKERTYTATGEQLDGMLEAAVQAGRAAPAVAKKAPPEVLPIRTTDRVLYELQPVESGYDWVAVRRIGDRLTAEVSPITYLDIRKAGSIEDNEAQNDAVLQMARVKTYYKGAPCGAEDTIPASHVYRLASKVVALSSVGADPFGEAPAGSSA